MSLYFKIVSRIQFLIYVSDNFKHIHFLFKHYSYQFSITQKWYIKLKI